MTTPDRRPALFRAYEHAADLVSDVDPGQLTGITPCSQFDVAGLIDHIVGAAGRAAALGRGEPPSGDEFPHVELSEAPDLLRRAGKEARSAWSDDAALVRTVTMPWGEVYTGATVVDVYLTELTAHAWDLATATGQTGRLDPDLGTAALDAARSMLKPEYRNLVEEGSPFGTEVAAPPDATDWEKLAAFTGRRP